MDASSPRSDAERELDDLRRRAYGRHPDIQADPVALARLEELEAALAAPAPDGADTGIGEPTATPHVAVGDDVGWADAHAERPDSEAEISPEETPRAGWTRSMWHRLTATPARRIASAAVVAVLVLAPTVAWLIAPHPDATLRAIEDGPDGVVLSLLDFLGADPVRSSIRGYQPYRGVEPWFSVDKEGFQCFMIVEPKGPAVDGANCVPPGVDLFSDTGAWPLIGDNLVEGLPDGSIVRFHYRGDSVDVYLYPASDTG